MTEKKNGFMMYKSHWEAISDLEDKYLGQLMRAIFEYQIEGKEPEKHDIIYRDFKHLKAQFVIDNAKYQRVAERNAENGKSGGRPRNPNENEITQANPENPLGFEKPRKADNDNDNGKDNDNDLSFTASSAKASKATKQPRVKKSKLTRLEAEQFYQLEIESIPLYALTKELGGAAAARNISSAALGDAYKDFVDYMTKPTDKWPNGMWGCLLTKPHQLKYDQYCKLILKYGMKRDEVKAYADSWENKGYDNNNLYASFTAWRDNDAKKPNGGSDPAKPGLSNPKTVSQ